MLLRILSPTHDIDENQDVCLKEQPNLATDAYDEVSTTQGEGGLGASSLGTSSIREPLRSKLTGIYITILESGHC